MNKMENSNPVEPDFLPGSGEENSWQVVKRRRSARKESGQCHGEMMYTKKDLAKTLKKVPGPDDFIFELGSKLEGQKKMVSMPKWKKPRKLLGLEKRSRGQKRKADGIENTKGSKKKELVPFSTLPEEVQDYYNYSSYIRGELCGNSPEIVEIPKVSQGLRTYIFGEAKKWYEEEFGVQVAAEFWKLKKKDDPLFLLEESWAAM